MYLCWVFWLRLVFGIVFVPGIVVDDVFELVCCRVLGLDLGLVFGIALSWVLGFVCILVLFLRVFLWLVGELVLFCGC